MAYAQIEPTNAYQSVDELTESKRHTLLSKARQRTILSVLSGRASAIELSELAATVAEREDGTDPDDETAVKRASVTLHHKHLPKLDACDVISYDSERQLVRP